MSNLNFKKMTKFKNVFLLAAMAVSAGFVGCNKEDDDENGGGAGGGSKADGSFEIKATVDTKGVKTVDSVTFEVKEKEFRDVLAKGTYVNGVLTITLPTIPATLENKYLSTIDVDDFDAGVKISAPNAKWYEDDDLNIYAWKDGIKVGEFGYGDETGDAGLHYVDKDVTITGTSTKTTSTWTYITHFNVSLKKGWNIVFYTNDSENEAQKTNTSTITTTVPKELKWSFLSRE